MAKRNVGAAVVDRPRGAGPGHPHRARHPALDRPRARTWTPSTVGDALSPRDLVFAAPDWSLEQAAAAMVRGRLPPPGRDRGRRAERDHLGARHRARAGPTTARSATSRRRRLSGRSGLAVSDDHGEGIVGALGRAWRRSARPAPARRRRRPSAGEIAPSMPSVIITSRSPARQRHRRRAHPRQPVAERRRRTRARRPSPRLRLGAHQPGVDVADAGPGEPGRARGRTRRAVITDAARVEQRLVAARRAASCGGASRVRRTPPAAASAASAAAPPWPSPSIRQRPARRRASARRPRGRRSAPRPSMRRARARRGRARARPAQRTPLARST